MQHNDDILPKGPYLPCARMAGGALLAGYNRIKWHLGSITENKLLINGDVIFINTIRFFEGSNSYLQVKTSITSTDTL